MSRPQKEIIEECFEQNNECHQSLKQAESFEAENAAWPMFIGVLLLGAAGGMILDAQLRH